MLLTIKLDKICLPFALKQAIDFNIYIQNYDPNNYLQNWVIVPNVRWLDNPYNPPFIFPPNLKQSWIKCKNIQVHLNS